jgi:hypothetical protein
MRRPHNQQALVAIPAQMSVNAFITNPAKPPLEDLETVDMARFRNIQNFQLPPGAGHRLTELTGISANAMFPDQIDLGYSYFSFIAWLSMAIHRPTSLMHSEKTKMSGRIHYEKSIVTARVILDHESIRLDPENNLSLEQSQFSDLHKYYTLADATNDVSRIAKMAYIAALVVTFTTTNPIDLARYLFRLCKKGLRLIWGSFKFRLSDADIEVRVGKQDTSGEVGWIIPELRRRYEQVKGIIYYAGKPPVYMLENRKNVSGFTDPIPTDTLYEEIVNQQIEADKKWTAKE